MEDQWRAINYLTIAASSPVGPTIARLAGASHGGWGEDEDAEEGRDCAAHDCFLW